jgi:hypothetical protein
MPQPHAIRSASLTQEVRGRVALCWAAGVWRKTTTCWTKSARPPTPGTRLAREGALRDPVSTNRGPLCSPELPHVE